MDWQRRYLEALRRVPNYLRQLRGVIVAYNTNIDGLKTVDGRWLSQLLAGDAQLKEKVVAKLDDDPGEINDLGDLISVLLYHVKRGAGGERLVYDDAVYRWLSGAFGPGNFRMGGQAGIMANVLSTLGVPLVVPHVAQLPLEQAELFDDQEKTRIPVLRPEGVFLERPIDAVRRGDKPLVHWVLNFTGGTEVSFDDTSIVSPRGNRFIATYDEDNTDLRITLSFKDGVRMRITEFDGAIVSGFHLLRKRYRDGSGFEGRIENALSQLREWRRLNPKLRLHLEMGSMQSPEVEEATLIASSHFDSLGVNEDELRSALSTLGLRSASEPISTEPSAEAVYKDALTLHSQVRTDRLNVHTRDFSISILTGQYATRLRPEQEGLLAGAAVAAGRALTGRFLHPEKLLELIATNAIPSSPKGERQHELLISEMGDESRAAAKSFREDGFAELNGLAVVFSPSRLVEKTISTVGLGDAISSTSFVINLI